MPHDDPTNHRLLCYRTDNNHPTADTPHSTNAMGSAAIWQSLEPITKTPEVRTSQLLKTKMSKLYPVSFVMARDRACSIRVEVASFTLIGTSILLAESSVYRVPLGMLIILRPSELIPMTQEVFNQYDKALHIGFYLDPKTELFFF